MIGAIAGDIIGSVYEWERIKTKEFELFSDECTFTDDTVLTVALADTILNGNPYAENLKRFYKWYSDRGYGGNFSHWAESEDSEPYRSWGNGAAMRISPVGFVFKDIDMVLKKAEEFTAVTHNHPEGIKGGQAAAAAIFMARTGSSKDDIRNFTAERFGYDMGRSVDDIRPDYEFNESSQETVPEAIIAFLDSVDYEDALRNAVSLGGDSDTLACITGGIAQAFYGGVPEDIENKVYEILDGRLGGITRRFMERYCGGK